MRIKLSKKEGFLDAPSQCSFYLSWFYWVLRETELKGFKMTEFYIDGQRIVAHACVISVLVFTCVIILKMWVPLDHIMSLIAAA